MYPPKDAGYRADENIVAGNVALYGATSGEAYINGIAGERFAVRNSGAKAVVEGIGDHGCEYMTGGMVAILGKVGKNFAAGMSGGIAYVLDEDNDFYKYLNKSMVAMEKVENSYEEQELRSLIEAHVAATGSEKGQRILDHFDEYLPKFKRIVPHDYRRILQLCAKYREQGMDEEQAQIEAFYESTKSRR